ncbi:MAG: hypothetical protein ACK4HE_02410 [Chitinophagaceae bacterium]|jgi:hypothetical protein
MQPQPCLFCGHVVQLIHVHGHYQCPLCHTNALPCCDGDNCSTNMLLQANEQQHLPQGINHLTVNDSAKSLTANDSLSTILEH